MGIWSYLEKNDFILFLSLVFLVLSYFFKRKAGRFVFTPEGIKWWVWGIVPTNTEWKNIAKIRKVKVFSQINKKETTAIRIVGYSEKWPWYLKKSAEPSLVLPSEVYDPKDLVNADIYGSYYLSQYAISAPSTAKIMQKAGKNLWENRWKVFIAYVLYLGVGISILMFPLFYMLFSSLNLKTINNTSLSFILSLLIFFLIVAWLYSKKFISQIVLFERNEYGSVFYEPNDEKSRFRIMAYVYPKGIRLLNAYPTDFTDKISVAPERPPVEEAFLSIHPEFVESGEIKHIVAMFKGDWQNTISLTVTFELKRRKFKEKVWLVGEREVNSITE